MFVVEQTIDLAAPTGRVWRALSDLDHYCEWHLFIALSGTAAPDAAIRMEHKTQIKMMPTISADAQIIRFEPQRVIAWRLGFRGLFQVEEGFDLEKTETGTRVTHRMRCSGLVSRLRIKVFERRMAEALSASNTALSRFLARGTTIARYAPGPRQSPRRLP